MNVGDTEIVVVAHAARRDTSTPSDIGLADVILINTCSIRDNAEQRIWGRLAEMQTLPPPAKPGARRGHHRLHGRTPQGEIGRGPLRRRRRGRDRTPTATCRAWCARPRRAARGSTSCSPREETYAEIAPVRLDRNGVSAYRGHHARMQQLLFLLRGALHPGPRTEPRSRRRSSRRRARSSGTDTAR